MHEFFMVKECEKNTAQKTFFSLIMVDSDIRINNKYYPQTLLEECKYKLKNYKMECNINYDFDTSSSDESDDEPDSVSDNNDSDNESKKLSKKSDIESKKSSKKSDSGTD